MLLADGPWGLVIYASSDHPSAEQRGPWFVRETGGGTVQQNVDCCGCVLGDVDTWKESPEMVY
jgi:hypothetical protein